MKKITVLLIAVMLVISLAACSQPQAEVTDNLQSSDPKGNENQEGAPQGITVNGLDFEKVEFDLLTDAQKNKILENRMTEGYDLFKNEDTGAIVLAIYLGQRPSAGYDVEVMSIEDNEGVTNVTLKELTPQTGQMVAQVLTYPVAIVKFDGATDNIKLNWLDKEEAVEDINSCEPADSLKDPNQPVSSIQDQMVSGEFVGLIDNNSMEVKTEDGPKAFRLSDDVKIIAYDLEEGNIITLTFYENENNQAIVTKIDVE